MTTTLDQIEASLRDLLGPASDVEGESGLRSNGRVDVRRVGYATNLTPETALLAQQEKIDLLVTHHDAWSFIYGMDDYCHSILSKAGIAHYFSHLPLDAAPFGTAPSLIEGLGASLSEGFSMDGDYPSGYTGRFAKAVTLGTVAEMMKSVTQEDVKVWNCGPPEISSVGVVTGAGFRAEYVKDAAEAGCQLYITGEQTLYLVQYCMFIGINLIVGSHTFTELPGVRSLVELLQKQHPELETVPIPETHYELDPSQPTNWST